MKKQLQLFCPRACEHLNFDEDEQEKIHKMAGIKLVHFCEKYNTRLCHLDAHPYIYKCQECLNAQ